jgi:toxin ParE1/3/4
VGSIAWTEEAQRWLRDIHEFIAQDNPAAADRVVRGIYDRAQVLARHPEIGHRYRDSKRHVRVFLYGHYRIAYLVKDGGDIDILGVFHGALNIERYSL